MPFLVPEWVQPPPEITLSEDEIHVWRVALDQPREVVSKLAKNLSEAETLRMAQFRFEIHRDRFGVGRGVLRRILALYVRLKANLLRFETGNHGKPRLIAPKTTIRFNLAHSHEVMLLAVVHASEIGVDVERVKAQIEYEQIARRFFSPQEHAALMAVPVAQRLDAFFACWTRKEAFIKARGNGLTLPLDQFDVSLQPTAPPQLLATRFNPPEVGQWSVYDLAMGENLKAAVVVSPGAWRFRFWEWSDTENL